MTYLGRARPPGQGPRRADRARRGRGGDPPRVRRRVGRLRRLAAAPRRAPTASRRFVGGADASTPPAARPTAREPAAPHGPAAPAHARRAAAELQRQVRPAGAASPCWTPATDPAADRCARCTPASSAPSRGSASRPALEAAGQTLTYAELGERAGAIAAALQQGGGPGPAAGRGARRPHAHGVRGRARRAAGGRGYVPLEPDLPGRAHPRDDRAVRRSHRRVRRGGWRVPAGRSSAGLERRARSSSPATYRALGARCRVTASWAGRASRCASRSRLRRTPIRRRSPT